METAISHTTISDDTDHKTHIKQENIKLESSSLSNIQKCRKIGLNSTQTSKFCLSVPADSNYHSHDDIPTSNGFLATEGFEGRIGLGCLGVSPFSQVPIDNGVSGSTSLTAPNALLIQPPVFPESRTGAWIDEDYGLSSNFDRIVYDGATSIIGGSVFVTNGFQQDTWVCPQMAVSLTKEGSRTVNQHTSSERNEDQESEFVTVAPFDVSLQPDRPTSAFALSASVPHLASCDGIRGYDYTYSSLRTLTQDFNAGSLTGTGASKSSVTPSARLPIDPHQCTNAAYVTDNDNASKTELELVSEHELDSYLPWRDLRVFKKGADAKTPWDKRDLIEARRILCTMMRDWGAKPKEIERVLEPNDNTKTNLERARRNLIKDAFRKSPWLAKRRVDVIFKTLLTGSFTTGQRFTITKELGDKILNKYPILIRHYKWRSICDVIQRDDDFDATEKQGLLAKERGGERLRSFFKPSPKKSKTKRSCAIRKHRVDELPTVPVRSRRTCLRSFDVKSSQLPL
jgi:hypothetical protein